MKKDKKQEELQSRRQFFKKAAKSALPILGAIALSQVPALGTAKKLTSDCSYGCYGSCYGSCAYDCKGNCKGDCLGSCKGSCGTSSYY